ncbi:MAG TPA: lipocalin-like domain-containing protein [Candidatus Polarisedimenticolaceae bacterium]
MLVAPLALVLTLAAWKAAVPDFAWSFPRDHWAHDGYRTEWWYLTGELEAVDDPGRTFGYQFTLFRIGVAPERPSLDSAWSAANLAMGHASVTDVAGSRHVFSDVLHRAMPLLGGFRPFPENPIGWIVAPAGTDGKWELRWNGAGFDASMRDDAKGIAFDLTTRPEKPLVLQGPNGFSRKGEGPTAASQYYSFTRLRTEGTLTVGGRSWKVRGSSWMDKEFGSSQLSKEQVGWDWFSLKLADGRDVMLYALRRADGTADFRNGTVIAADGTPRGLDPSAWSVRATGSWTSPATGATYPSGWIVELPSEGLRLAVVPLLREQENAGLASGGVFYWEGAVEIRDAEGERVGSGYVELTGYGKGSRPPV